MTGTLSWPTVGGLLEGDDHTALGDWRPEPGSVPPPGWHETASDRAKLEFACATLRHYGVATAAGAAGTPEQVAARLTAILQARRPGADWAFVFWTAEERDRAMDPSGALRHPLEVHATGNGVEEAAAAAFRRAGLTVRPGGTSQVLSVGG